MGTKASRQKMIQKIIEKEEIGTQFDLAERLKQHGYNVTQATVSRDIKEIGLIKIPVEGNFSKYSMPVNISVGNIAERMRRMFIDNAVSIDSAENLIIVKTLPGTAQGLAACLDQCGWQEIIGCIAGDDTILIIIKDKQMMSDIIVRFESLMN
ncbi:MAG: arginine repressor [Bacillota bacterium]|jgi:transcriptional regulator of arginine metabolism